LLAHTPAPSGTAAGAALRGAPWPVLTPEQSVYADSTFTTVLTTIRDRFHECDRIVHRMGLLANVPADGLKRILRDAWGGRRRFRTAWCFRAVLGGPWCVPDYQLDPAYCEWSGADFSGALTARCSTAVPPLVRWRRSVWGGDVRTEVTPAVPGQMGRAGRSPTASRSRRRTTGWYGRQAGAMVVSCAILRGAAGAPARVLEHRRRVVGRGSDPLLTPQAEFLPARRPGVSRCPHRAGQVPSSARRRPDADCGIFGRELCFRRSRGRRRIRRSGDRCAPGLPRVLRSHSAMGRYIAGSHPVVRPMAPDCSGAYAVLGAPVAPLDLRLVPDQAPANCAQ